MSKPLPPGIPVPVATRRVPYQGATLPAPVPAPTPIKE
jgi:hypothetical protein